MPRSLSAPPPVYIVVLNWNGWEDTLRCLESLDRLTYPNYRMLVVDNGSRDGSESRLRELRPDIELMETGENLGYGGGNNAGIQRAMADGADYVWILNNDTKIPPDALDRLMDVMRKTPDVGILGVDAIDPQAGSPVALVPVPGVAAPALSGVPLVGRQASHGCIRRSDRGGGHRVPRRPIPSRLSAALPRVPPGE